MSHFADAKHCRIREYGLEACTFDKKNIIDFDKKTIESILQSWIKYFKDRIKNKSQEVFNEDDGIIGAFYRYIQLANTLGEDKRKKLADYLNTYLSRLEYASAAKERMIKFLSIPVLDSETTNGLIIKTLCNNDKDLIKAIISEGGKLDPKIDHCDKLKSKSS